MFKYAFVVGRFQPLHLAHEQLIKEALNQAENVIVFLGSSQESKTQKNPFSVDQRKYLFYQAFKDDIHRFTFVALPDLLNDLNWAASIEIQLKAIVGSSTLCNICFNKDEATTQSNNLLQGLYNTTQIVINQTQLSLNATDIRQIIIEDKVCPLQLVGTHLSLNVAKTLKEFLSYE